MKMIKHDMPVKVTGGANLTKTVSQVTWTADKGHGIAPGQFDEFEPSVGPFSNQAGTDLVFPTMQTYSAPAFTLAASSEADTATSAPDTADATNTSSTSTLSIVAPVTALVGLAIAVAALGLATRLRRRV